MKRPFQSAVRCLTFLTFLLAGTAFSHATLGDFWEWRNPLPQGNSLYGVAYGEPGGNGVYVAVGEAGTILSSDLSGDELKPDEEIAEAKKWIVRPSGTRQWLTGVTYEAGQFVVVGNRGRILTSPNGREWTCQYSGTEEWLWDVTYLDDHFWAVGSNGTIMSSPDAVHWSFHPLDLEPEVPLPFLRTIAFSGTTFVAGGDAGRIFFSDDAELWAEIDWEEEDLDVFAAIHSIIYAGDRFIAVGAWGTILFSDDGKENWTEPEEFVTGQDLWQIIHDNNEFLVAGASGTLLISTDGEFWEEENTGIVNAMLGLTRGDERVAIVARAGRILRSLTQEEMNDPDNPFDEPWEDISKGVRNSLFGVSDGDEKIVIAGDSGRILRLVGVFDDEEEEFEWSTEFSGTSNWLRDIVFAGGLENETEEGTGRFVTVGNNSTIRYSEDAEEWESAFPELTGHIEAITFGNEKLVIVGRFGQIHVSEDAEGWTSTTPDYDPPNEPDPIDPYPARWLRGVTYGNGRYVAVGDNGRILTSSTANVWEREVAPTTAPLFAVAHGGEDGNEKFIAVGRFGLMLSSLDGVEWFHEDSGTFMTLHAIAYHNGVWLTVGDWGTILASHDGEIWFDHNSGTNHSLRGVAYSETEEMFITVGDGGTVLSSTDADDFGLNYWAWVAEHGLTEDDRWPEANPSRDGLKNLVKFAMGLDPNLSQPEMAPAIEMIEEDPEHHLALTFQKATNVVGVGLSLDASETLFGWVNTAYEEEELDEDEEENWLRVRWRELHDVSEDNRRFLRLRASETDRFECSPSEPIEDNGA